jgi:hypothetical protein
MKGTANPSRSGMARGLAGGSGFNRQDQRSRRVYANRDGIPSNSLPEFPVGLPNFSVCLPNFPVCLPNSPGSRQRIPGLI